MHCDLRVMTVPETSIYEYARLIPPQYHVRLPRQSRMVKAIAETMRPQEVPHYHLRLSILAMDSRHIYMSLLRCQSIRHNHPLPLYYYTLYRYKKTITIAIQNTKLQIKSHNPPFSVPFRYQTEEKKEKVIIPIIEPLQKITRYCIIHNHTFLMRPFEDFQKQAMKDTLNNTKGKHGRRTFQQEEQSIDDILIANDKETLKMAILTSLNDMEHEYETAYIKAALIRSHHLDPHISFSVFLRAISAFSGREYKYDPAQRVDTFIYHEEKKFMTSRSSKWQRGRRIVSYLTSVFMAYR